MKGPFRILSSRRALVILTVLLVLVCTVGLFVWTFRDPLRWPGRRHWKNEAIARIEDRLKDPQWIAAESIRLKAASSRQREGSWVAPEMLLAENGDWIICQSVCSKENWRISDLFIGRGSDGKWYYSTFHFCIDKESLKMERQPESLASFADAYWLAPFDGKSDECLKVTWTGREPWGEDKRPHSKDPAR